MPEKKETRDSIRWNPQDKKILDALKKKLGIKQPEIIRMGIRVLAEQQGLRP